MICGLLCNPGLFAWLSLGKIPGDFWWHLRTGQLIVNSGQIPSVDALTFTRAGQPYTTQTWLMQAIYYLPNRAGDLPLMVFFHRIVIVAGYALVELACFAESSGEAASCISGNLLCPFSGCDQLGAQTAVSIVPMLRFAGLHSGEASRPRREGHMDTTYPVRGLGQPARGVYFRVVLLRAYLLAALVRCFRTPRASVREALPLILSTLLSLACLSLIPVDRSGFWSMPRACCEAALGKAWLRSGCR